MNQTQIHMMNMNECSNDDITELPSDDDMIFLTHLYETVVPVIFSIIAIFGVVGNLFVIYVILQRKHMRTSLNILLLNLAMADMCFLIFCVPLTTYHYASRTWELGHIVCHLSSYPYFVSFYVTMLTLVLISTWRYMTVIHSTRTTTYRTQRMALICSCLIWITMCIANIPTLMMNELKIERIPCSPPYRYCGTGNIHLTKGVYLSFFICGYAVPLLFICGLYVLLVCYVKKHAVVPRTQRVTRLVILVVTAFGFCWLPLHVCLVLAYYGKPPSGTYYHVVRVLCQLLAYSNSCMNPIIYNMASKSFRDSFFSLFSPCCYKKALCSISTERRETEGCLAQQDTREILLMTQYSLPCFNKEESPESYKAVNTENNNSSDSPNSN